jgi:hypothetical protein
MKIKHYMAAASLAVLTAGSASAQTVINITGATAFRQAAHDAILNTLDTGAEYGFSGPNLGNAARAIFEGTINGGGDSVIIRTSWSGSVAGIRAIADATAPPVAFFSTANLTTLTTNGTANATLALTNALATTEVKIAFADNAQENTPFDAASLETYNTGVVAFVPVVNENPYTIASSSNNTTQTTVIGTNVTTLMLRRLLQSGSAPLQFITGNSSHAGKTAYWTGRQDTSGTRVIYLTELGLGASQLVQQWRVEPLSTNATVPVSAIRIWPTGDATNQSTLWGADTVGNGGYASGGALAPVLQRTSGNVTIKDAGNATILTNQDIVLFSVISSQEGQDIQNGGGMVLAYNGSYIEPEALPNNLSPFDQGKIASGKYSFWSYERLFTRDDLLDLEIDFVEQLVGNIPDSIGGNGVKLSDMKVSRALATDGGIFQSVTLP